MSDRIRFAERSSGAEQASNRIAENPLWWAGGLVYISGYILLGLLTWLPGVQLHPLIHVLVPVGIVLAVFFGVLAAQRLRRDKIGVYFPAIEEPADNGRTPPGFELGGEQPVEGEMRIRCVGSPGLLETYGELADVPFEPMVFNASWAWRTSRTVKIIRFTIAAAIAVAWVTARHFLFSPTPGMGMFEFAAASFAGWLAIGWFCPVYLRFVPGRLDVIRCTPLARKPSEIQRYDLRKTPILIDLRNWVIFVEDADRPISFCYLYVVGWKRVVWGLLLAALSSHAPGPCPDDDLSA